MESMGMSSVDTFETFWKNKKVWVSGHSGFKGGWLCLILKTLGARVAGYSLPPHTHPNLFETLKIDQWIESSIFGDIRNRSQIRQSLHDFNPEIILHLAAQPIVSESHSEILGVSTS